ncbi:PKD domain-containing protein [Candidatus Bipolaricaulota bacterium]|nr:PKD domain-containing protein [Candidatus Bipolaricaulota bacterium]
MFTGRRAAQMGSGKLVAALLLVTALVIGLAACRGFFGQAPIALIVVDIGGDDEVPVMVGFDISGSNDPDGTVVSYDLDFGDGSAHATGTDVADAIEHDYTEAGDFTVLIIVTDNDGRIGMANATVTIGPVMITFASDRVSDYDIYRMEDDGSGQGIVYNSTVDELFPDLVRGTRDLVAHAAEDGTSWDIWTMTIAGGSLTQLTTQTLSNQIQPSWSRDVSMIAYASNEQSPSASVWDIYTMTAVGGTQAQLTTQTPSWAIAPSYSPVNDDILFVSSKTATGGSAIWMWDDGLGAAVELYDSSGRDGDVSSAVAGLATALDLPAGAGISRPVWSPDGSKIAFSTDQGARGGIDIYVMDSDGTGAETLEDYVNALLSAAGEPTVVAESITPLGATLHEFCPYWLEDDSGIVFVKDTGAGTFQLYKVAFETGAVTQLTATGNNVTPTRAH